MTKTPGQKQQNRRRNKRNPALKIPDGPVESIIYRVFQDRQYFHILSQFFEVAIDLVEASFALVLPARREDVFDRDSPIANRRSRS